MCNACGRKQAIIGTLCRCPDRYLGGALLHWVKLPSFILKLIVQTYLDKSDTAFNVGGPGVLYFKEQVFFGGGG